MGVPFPCDQAATGAIIRAMRFILLYSFKWHANRRSTSPRFALRGDPQVNPVNHDREIAGSSWTDRSGV
jgi:hypothetical protein